MLRPDFGVVAQAFDFNLGWLPLLAAGLAVVFFALGRIARAGWVWGALFAAVALGLGGLRYWVRYHEPHRLAIRTARIETDKLRRPVRILHVSDIQAARIGAYERSVFERMRELSPDLILNTGDHLQVGASERFAREFAEMRRLFATVDPPLGVYSVFGDSDMEMHRLGQGELEPIRLLSSRSATIRAGGGRLSLHGLSLYQSRHPEWAERSVTPWLEEAPENAFRILMGHAPDYALAMRDKAIELCLAGHTHGGQVVLPFYGPLVIDSAVPKAWAKGFRRIGRPFLNVSAGAGSNRFQGLPPIRFNCPTEMTVIDLVPEPARER